MMLLHGAVARCKLPGRPADEMMRMLAVAVAALLLVPSAGYAQTKTCKAQAAERNLTGAALFHFMKTCEADAEKACDTSATESKPTDAPKSGSTKKCVT